MLKTTKIISTKSFKIAIYARGSVDADKLALVLPGKLDSKDYPHMRCHVDSLAENGFYALSFDPPGTWESEGDISIYTMTSYLQAINELIEYFGNKPTFLVGHSRGGSMAMLAGTRNQYVTHFASVISNATFDPKVKKHYPNKKWQEKGYMIERRDAPVGYSEDVIYKFPYSFLEDEIQYDMLPDLKACKKPKLFIGSIEDPFTSLATTKKIYQDSSDPKYIHILEINDHDYRKHLNFLDEVDELLLKFATKMEI